MEVGAAVEADVGVLAAAAVAEVAVVAVVALAAAVVAVVAPAAAGDGRPRPRVPFRR